jgi:hypothetical protein
MCAISVVHSRDIRKHSCTASSGEPFCCTYAQSLLAVMTADIITNILMHCMRISSLEGGGWRGWTGRVGMGGGGERGGGGEGGVV